MTRPTKIRDGLYVSNGSAAREYGDEFEHVITLSRSVQNVDVGPHEHTTQHFPLIDGRNEQDDFDRAVGATIKAIESDGDVLVHCQAGLSRSPTVVITALAERDDESFDSAYDYVKAKKMSIVPHPELRKHAKEFLGEDDSVYKNPF